MTVPPLPEGEPAPTLADPHMLLEGYLDHYRRTLVRKAGELSEQQLRSSALPSGWTPLELIRHLTYVERRWLRWGFMAEAVPDPWGDRGPDDRWHVPEGLSSERVLAEFEEQCARSREISSSAEPAQRARVGGRFTTEKEAPTLAWILFHLLQEYARHVGHLDVVVELAAGRTGE
ncbi:DinB family protein [Streptomyces iconiensis]|uniref:DinB family protein n=1 Tax=Streptomyces iconiensis TaxID=1384038 RepID=A0ABT6ZUF7_9ACTN|nr:DinB family protein [Streptomyces iconiensis]MDJ1132695.1 DinB family protein [Streptomyces iconiensis]